MLETITDPASSLETKRAALAEADGSTLLSLLDDRADDLDLATLSLIVNHLRSRGYEAVRMNETTMQICSDDTVVRTIDLDGSV